MDKKNYDELFEELKYSFRGGWCLSMFGTLLLASWDQVEVRVSSYPEQTWRLTGEAKPSEHSCSRKWALCRQVVAVQRPRPSFLRTCCMSSERECILLICVAWFEPINEPTSLPDSLSDSLPVCIRLSLRGGYSQSFPALVRLKISLSQEPQPTPCESSS